MPAGSFMFRQWLLSHWIRRATSPQLDYMVFTGITGSNLTSVYPMGHNDDHQFISFRKAAASIGNDVECARSILGAWSVIYDKECSNYLKLADQSVMAFARVLRGRAIRRDEGVLWYIKRIPGVVGAVYHPGIIRQATGQKVGGGDKYIYFGNFINPNNNRRTGCPHSRTNRHFRYDA